jgi:hypothetical protein
MRVRASGFGLFCLAILFLGESSTFAAVNEIVTTPLQTRTIQPTTPNWGPTTPSLQGQNPMVFDKFDPSLGQLQSVNVSVTFTVTNLVSMNFVTPATITLRTGTNGQGTSIGLDEPDGRALLRDSAPIFTYTRASSGPATFSNDTTKVAVGSRFFLTPDGESGNLASAFVGNKQVTVSDPSQLALFTGTGTFGLPVTANARNQITTTSGNGGGSIITFVGMQVSLSYNYVVPEPSSAALLGLGGGGILLAGRLRRRRLAI